MITPTLPTTENRVNQFLRTVIIQFPILASRIVPTLLGLAVAAQASVSDSAPRELPEARVVIVQDPAATRTYTPQPREIRTMIENGLLALWGSPETGGGWSSCLTEEDIVGILIHSSPGQTGGTRPAVASAIIESLIAHGHPPERIILWDRQLATLQAAGYLTWEQHFGIQVAGARQAGYDSDRWYESSLIGTLSWGDLEFGKKGDQIGRRSYLSTLLTQKITKIVNVTPLLNHNRAGVCGNLVNLALASVDNVLRFQSNPQNLAIAIPEIIALPEVGDRIILNVVDALIVQYQGETQTRLQDSTVLNQLRFSVDPVALDVLSIEELERQRALKEIAATEPNRRLYQNASLLEIGISDPERIRIYRLPDDPPGNFSRPALNDIR